jgi:stage II sporulation protein GA (sporulation sigma-E factor processing peptidase)
MRIWQSKQRFSCLQICNAPFFLPFLKDESGKIDLGDGMRVYVDEVFLLNGLVDYLLLRVCAKLTLSPLYRKRLLLAGAFGGAYAVWSLLPGWTFLGCLLWRCVSTGLLCFVAFGRSRMLLRQSLVLLLLAAAFSGLVLLLTELFSAPAALIGGTVYYPLSLGVLILTAGGSYGLISWGLGRLMQHGGDVEQVELTLLGKTLRLTALHDTGNTLKDPLSGCPVLVTDWQVLASLIPGLSQAAFSSPQDLVTRLRETKPELSPRLIPYKTVGVGHGLLLALRPEEVKISGKQETLLIAFSPVAVSDGGGYQALLGGRR